MLFHWCHYSEISLYVFLYHGHKRLKHLLGSISFVTLSLLFERCNIFSARPMRKPPDFSLVWKRCNNFPRRVMRKARISHWSWSGCNKIRLRVMRKPRISQFLWNVLKTKKESVHSRDSLGDHTLSFCINGEIS